MDKNSFVEFFGIKQDGCNWLRLQYGLASPAMLCSHMGAPRCFDISDSSKLCLDRTEQSIYRRLRVASTAAVTLGKQPPVKVKLLPALGKFIQDILFSMCLS